MCRLRIRLKLRLFAIANKFLQRKADTQQQIYHSEKFLALFSLQASIFKINSHVIIGGASVCFFRYLEYIIAVNIHKLQYLLDIAAGTFVTAALHEIQQVVPCWFFNYTKGSHKHIVCSVVYFDALICKIHINYCADMIFVSIFHTHCTPFRHGRIKDLAYDLTGNSEFLSNTGSLHSLASQAAYFVLVVLR